MQELSARQAAIDTVLGDPPLVHARLNAPTGVWGTDRDCYEFLAENVTPESRTLETGCGISTGLFAVWGTEHTCVVPDAEEASELREWATSRSIDTARLTFEIGGSQDVLPRLAPTELDLVFIDGAHGFPLPIVDWFYAAGRLRAGGIVVLDDIQLPHVRLGLFEYLDADPRWEPIALTPKWAAVLRHSSGPLAEEFVSQPFLSGE